MVEMSQPAGATPDPVGRQSLPWTMHFPPLSPVVLIVEMMVSGPGEVT